ncbi:MAG: hypothetical protein Q7T03_04500 [Deltaproteobacteria bacterium]|nr:hypothetical protein [Deltaproteobacteria bacterium]
MVTLFNIGLVQSLPTVTLAASVEPTFSIATDSSTFSLVDQAGATLKHLLLYVTGQTPAQRSAFFRAYRTSEFGGIPIREKSVVEILLAEADSLKIDDGRIPPNYSDPQKVAKLLESAFAEVDAEENPRLAAQIAAQLAPIYFGPLDNPILALIAYGDAAKHFEIIGDDFNAAFNLLNVARISMQLGKFSQAVAVFEHAFEIENRFHPDGAKKSLIHKSTALQCLEDRGKVLLFRQSGAKIYCDKLGEEMAFTVAHQKSSLVLEYFKNGSPLNVEDAEFFHWALEELEMTFYIFKQLGDVDHSWETGWLRLQILDTFGRWNWAIAAAEELMALLPDVGSDWHKKRQRLHTTLEDLRRKSQLS